MGILAGHAAGRVPTAECYMVDENDLRPVKLPFPGSSCAAASSRCTSWSCPTRPGTGGAAGPGRDRRTGFSVKSLAPEAALEGGVPFTRGEVGAAGALSKQQAEAERDEEAKCVLLRPRRQRAVFVEDADIQVIKEDMINNAPMVPRTRLW